MSGVNKVILVGNLGANPEMRYTQAGQAVANLRLATTERWTDKSGQKQEAIQNYNTLIKQYPASRFVPDAYVQMGEHFFQSNDLTRARAAFEKAASFRLPKLYPFALYKLAWCDYNAGEYQGSIEKFKEVIAYAEGGSKDRIQLKAEALKDIVLAYAQIDAIDSAATYLHEKGGEL